ncbi:hypothetical protein BDR07DRAFT_1278880 [Suillus spraguei]|nr:hypothetical protein BDR07DRAFT_1278880 [Suillus spraguei]
MGSCYHIDNLKGVHLTRHRRLLTSIVSLTALAAHYTTVLMAQEKEKAFWTEPEVTALVDYLHEHRSEHAEGGNFKIVIFNEAAKAIAPKRAQGPLKTGKMCPTKWTSVRCYHIYNAIDKYCKQSGINQWHPEYGANIQGEAAAAVFDAYVQQKSNSAMCPFRNCGWVYLERMQEILPVGGARGVGAFRATDVPVPSINDEPDVDAAGVQAPGSSSSMSGDVIMSGANAPPPLSMPPLSGTPIMSGINAPPPLSMTPPSGTCYRMLQSYVPLFIFPLFPYLYIMSHDSDSYAQCICTTHAFLIRIHSYVFTVTWSVRTYWPI